MKLSIRTLAVLLQAGGEVSNNAVQRRTPEQWVELRLALAEARDVLHSHTTELAS